MPDIFPTDGRWLVTTENSSFELDLDEMTVVREPGEAARALRGDHELTVLLRLLALELGHPLIYVMRVENTDVLRATSKVVGIDPLDPS